MSAKQPDVVRILDVSETSEINSLLAKGWFLVGTYTTDMGAERPDQMLQVVLGRQHDRIPVHEARTLAMLTLHFGPVGSVEALTCENCAEHKSESCQYSRLSPKSILDCMEAKGESADFALPSELKRHL